MSVCSPLVGGGTPYQVWIGGYPVPGLGCWGVPHPRSGWWGGVLHPRSRWWGGYPIPGLDSGGVPQVPAPWLDDVSPPTTMTGWGTPPSWLDGVPPPATMTMDGVPPPLAFTQEDFLVINMFAVEWGISCREGGSVETSHRERTLRGDDEEGVHARRLRSQHGGHVHVPWNRTTR